MKIEVVLSPALYDGRQLKEHHTTVVVDILRATSALCAAFTAGAAEIVPLDSLEPLAQYQRLGFTLAAERNGEKVQGATCGNSPTEYLSMNLEGQRIAYSTTNGTVSILKASDSDKVLIGAFCNLNALAKKLMADTSLRDVVVLCSGWKGDPSLEDTLFAGALIAELRQLDNDVTLVNDAASMAEDLWLAAKGNLYDYCCKATHVQRLLRLNYEADIRWAFKRDTSTVVPQYLTGKLIVNN